MTIYFTADLHLGHENILASRTQFQTIDEMDQYMIERWNKVVHANDEIYILGDLMFRNRRSPMYYLEKLKGRKHLIIGNHDEKWMKQVNLDDYFISVDRELILKNNHKKYTLSHYPWIEFPGSRYAKYSSAYMIHGHIHSNKVSGTYEIIKKHFPNLLNCGQDICDFKPVTIDELIEQNNVWYQR